VKKANDLIENTVNDWGKTKRGVTGKLLGAEELKKRSTDELASKILDFYNVMREFNGVHRTVSNMVEDLMEENAKLKEIVKEKDTLKLHTGDGIKSAVKDLLPGVVTQVVKEIVKPDSKGKMSWAEILKTGLKDQLVGDMNKTFETTIGTQLAKNQNEIMRKTAQKQDQDYYERERRSRNVVISNVEESKSERNHERINFDKEAASAILDISTDDVVKVFRAGPQLGTGKNKERTKPRILIVTMKTPEMAKSRHNYGMGVKELPEEGTSSYLSEGDSCFWINPDLSRTERIANYEARKLRNQRRQTANNGNRPSFPGAKEGEEKS